MYGILLIVAMWTLKVFRDAIQFGKKGDSVFELWHIVDLSIHAISALVIFATLNIEWWWILFLLFYGYLSYNYIYKYFKKIDVAEWDNNIVFPVILQKLLEVKHEKD